MWLDVPFVPQEKNACGAAALAMVMQYWDQQQGRAPTADAKQIEDAIYSPEARGIFASEMRQYLEQNGYRAFAFHGELSDLQQHLEKGRPLIVALVPPSSDPHYVVIAGIDLRERVVIKNDPAERKLLKQDIGSFEQQWKAAGNWTLLAVPR